VIPAGNVVVQAKVGETCVALVGVYVNVEPEQIAVGVKVLVNAGVGFTTTDTLFVAEQLFAPIVYTYVTVIGAFVVFVNTSLIPFVPDEAVSVIPVTVARDHAKSTVPVVATVLLVGVYANVDPEQISAGVKVLDKAGVGLIVTVTVNEAPTQFPAAPEVGVTV
jgi:hypothetical protein